MYELGVHELLAQPCYRLIWMGLTILSFSILQWLLTAVLHLASLKSPSDENLIFHLVSMDSLCKNTNSGSLGFLGRKSKAFLDDLQEGD